MFFQSFIPFRSVVVSGICGYPLMIYIDLYGLRGCPYRTEAVDIGIMDTVKEIVIIHMVIKGNFCLLPLGVFIFG